MYVTRLTSHAEISLLKDEASENIDDMSSTRLTFHAEISMLKDVA